MTLQIKKETKGIDAKTLVWLKGTKGEDREHCSIDSLTKERRNY